MKLATKSQNTTLEPFYSVYQTFTDKGLDIPPPLELMSTSPQLFGVYTKILSHYVSQETLDYKLLACIRYTVAHKMNFGACIQFNKKVLSLYGLAEKIHLLHEELPTPPLEETDKSIFHFAIDAIFYSERITQERIDTLVSQQISQQTLFEAAFHGALLLSMGPLVKAMK